MMLWTVLQLFIIPLSLPIRASFQTASSLAQGTAIWFLQDKRITINASKWNNDASVCLSVYLFRLWPKMFTCSVLEWQYIHTNTYTCTHTHAHTDIHCLYISVKAKCDQVQQTVTCIFQYFLLNPPFNFLMVANCHHRICYACCILPQAETCAFQKALAKKSLLFSKTSLHPNSSYSRSMGQIWLCVQTME